MPRPPKKPHWQTLLPKPEWAGGPPHVSREVITDRVLVGHSTPTGSGQLWRIRRVAADGSSELVTMAGEPWEGTGTQAALRAQVLGQEDPDGRYIPEKVES
jgi:hypothetical protein